VLWVASPKGDPLPSHGDWKNSPGFCGRGRIETGKDGYTVKKLIALLLVTAFLTAGLAGCGSGETKTTTKATTPPAGSGTTPPGGGK
jgi:hypothetical protein